MDKHKAQKNQVQKYGWENLSLKAFHIILAKTYQTLHAMFKSTSIHSFIQQVICWTPTTCQSLSIIDISVKKTDINLKL